MGEMRTVENPLDSGSVPYYDATRSLTATIELWENMEFHHIGVQKAADSFSSRGEYTFAISYGGPYV